MRSLVGQPDTTGSDMDDDEFDFNYPREKKQATHETEEHDNGFGAFYQPAPIDDHNPEALEKYAYSPWDDFHLQKKLSNSQEQHRREKERADNVAHEFVQFKETSRVALEKAESRAVDAEHTLLLTRQDLQYRLNVERERIGAAEKKLEKKEKELRGKEDELEVAEKKLKTTEGAEEELRITKKSIEEHTRILHCAELSIHVAEQQIRVAEEKSHDLERTLQIAETRLIAMEGTDVKLKAIEKVLEQQKNELHSANQTAELENKRASIAEDQSWVLKQTLENTGQGG
jgi:hypothetical protein